MPERERQKPVHMPAPKPSAEPPLASYVLRVQGRPATLRYELHNLRSGERRVFFKADRLAAHLRQLGLEGLTGGAEPAPASA